MKAKTCDNNVTMNCHKPKITKNNGEHENHESSKIGICGTYIQAKNGRKRFPKPRVGRSIRLGRTRLIKRGEPDAER